MKNPKDKKNCRVLTCLEAGCPLASKETSTCKDLSCLAHPSNIDIKVVGRGIVEKEETKED